MSWACLPSTCLQAQAAESLETSYKDTLQSLLLKSKGIPEEFCCKDSLMEFYQCFPFGTMLKHSEVTTQIPPTFSKKQRRFGSLSAFAEDSRVDKTYLVPEKAQELQAKEAAYGESSQELFAKYDQNTHSWKTAQCSLLADSGLFLETWPKWGVMRNGECSELIISGHHTKETESGFWRTPNASDGEGGVMEMRVGATGHYKLRDHVQPINKQFWPTPQAIDSNGKGRLPRLKKDGNRNHNIPGSYCADLKDVVLMWPTPCRTDYKGSGKTGELRDRLDYAAERGATKSNTYATPQTRDFRIGQQSRWDNPNRTRNLNDQIGGQLNADLAYPLDFS
jgi:hypothetical protein